MILPFDVFSYFRIYLRPDAYLNALLLRLQLSSPFSPVAALYLFQGWPGHDDDMLPLVFA